MRTPTTLFNMLRSDVMRGVFSLRFLASNAVSSPAPLAPQHHMATESGAIHTPLENTPHHASSQYLE